MAVRDRPCATSNVSPSAGAPSSPTRYSASRSVNMITWMAPFARTGHPQVIRPGHRCRERRRPGWLSGVSTPRRRSMGHVIRDALQAAPRHASSMRPRQTTRVPSLPFGSGHLQHVQNQQDIPLYLQRRLPDGNEGLFAWTVEREDVRDFTSKSSFFKRLCREIHDGSTIANLSGKRFYSRAGQRPSSHRRS